MLSPRYFIVRSHIKPKQHHIAVAHHILFALAAHKPFFLGGGHGPGSHEFLKADDFGADKPFFKIRVDFTRGLRGFRPVLNGPRATPARRR
jgi:hypothetical protein